MGVELQDVIFNLSKTLFFVANRNEALFLRLFDAYNSSTGSLFIWSWGKEWIDAPCELSFWRNLQVGDQMWPRKENHSEKK